MKMKTFILFFLLFSESIFCQSPITNDEIGRQLFEILKTQDTVSLKSYIINKELILEAIKNSKNVSDKDKKAIIQEIGREIEYSKKTITESISTVYSNALKSGVDLNNAKYINIRLEINKNSGNFENVKSYNLTIVISYYEVKYEIYSKIMELNNRVFIEKQFKWENSQ
jgi:uncharacterized protein (UPF0335 family)